MLINNYYFIIVYIAACEDISTEISDELQISASTITASAIGHGVPSLEGEWINFTCTSERVLIGPNSTICMGNGEWKPDPREVTCKGKNQKSYNSIVLLLE